MANNPIADIETPENLLRQTIIDHNNYTDANGETGSEPQWLFFNIQNKITKTSGLHINEIAPEILSYLYEEIRHIVNEGELSGLTRREIKDLVYDAINVCSGNYKTNMGVQNE